MLRAITLFALVSVCAPATAVPASAQEVVNQTIRIGGGDQGPLSILPPGRQAKTGTGRLRGRVLAADSGAPLRRAQVRVTSPDIGTKTTMTDNQGRFEFRDLPASRFTLSVAKSGFVTVQYGQTRPFEPGRPIELADAQAMDKADIAMPRGGVLAGRVVDEVGEQVAEAEVSAMRMQYQNGKRRLVPTGRTTTTNDLGQFRIYGLPPGEYYVSARLSNGAGMLMAIEMLNGSSATSGPNQNTGYASTYYPSTPNPAEAQRVTLAVGQELSSVDIQLQPVRLAKITGTAMGSDGKPMSGAMVMLMPTTKEASMFVPGGSSRTDKDGNFTLSSVTPGEYSLQVQSMGGVFQADSGNGTMMFAFRTGDPSGRGGQAQSQQREFAMTAVNVTGEDITGLVVVGTRGAKATGTISFAGGAKPEGASTIRVSAPAADADANPMPSFGGSNVKEGTTQLEFQLEGLVGNRILRVANAPRGWSLKSVKVNGEDVTDRGVEFKPGEDVAGIEIELTNKSTSIGGSVTAENGQPAKDFTVVVFSDDQQKWMLPQNRWMTSARPDQEGRFRINNLPPGSYYGIAVDYVAQGEWQDPEWLARAAKKATKFTLDEGASKSLDLKLAGS